MSLIIKSLVVAGGGGGGGGSTNNAHKPGAGGAGGYIANSAFVVTEGAYTITVGAGGAGGVGPVSAQDGNNGGNSVFGSQIAIGGGGGGVGANGGSGGSNAGLGTSGQGNNGVDGISNSSGGGGGASGNGGTGTTTVAGPGGAGITNDISGASVAYAGGGGGGCSKGNTCITGGSATAGGGAGAANGSGSHATANTGGGGGSASWNGSVGGSGGNGGSGIVIISYATDGSDGVSNTSTGGTITTSGNQTIHTFTTSGTFTVVRSYLTSNPVTDIAQLSATGNAEVINDQGSTITERGFCWSTSPTPTTSDNKVTSSGTVGIYSASMTGLLPNTTYYVRPYYINALGTFYASYDVSFTTLVVNPYDLIYDLDGIDGDVYAGRITVTGTVGTITVKFGNTGDSTVINAGDGVTEFFGTYSGGLGLMITRSSDFDGTIDDVYYSKTTATTIDWNEDNITAVTEINSSVTFKRVEAEDFNSFRFYRYLDLLFKNLNGYVTVTIRSEREDAISEKTKTFSVGNTGSGQSAFQKRRISFLIKNQAVVISLSNSSQSETFSIAKYILTGHQKPKKMFSPSKIKSV